MTPSLERLQALWRIRSAFEIWNYLGKLEESTRCNWIKKCKALPLGMRNQNPKHKLDQSYCWRQWQTSLFHQGIKRQVGCYSADSAPLCPETAPCWGVHLQKKGRWNEKILEMMSSIEEKKDITSFPAWSVPGFTTLLQISPSAESHWCHGIVFKYKTTSPCSLVHPLPHFLKSTGSPSSPFPLQPSVWATGAPKNARLFRELVIFSWNWPGHNGEGCQILCTPF